MSINKYTEKISIIKNNTGQCVIESHPKNTLTWFTKVGQVPRSISSFESILTDLSGEGSYLSELGVGDGVQVQRSLVRQVMENIESPNGLRSSLLVAEDEIDPLVQLTGHKFTLQRLRQEEDNRVNTRANQGF